MSAFIRRGNPYECSSLQQYGLKACLGCGHSYSHSWLTNTQFNSARLYFLARAAVPQIAIVPHSRARAGRITAAISSVTCSRWCGIWTRHGQRNCWGWSGVMPLLSKSTVTWTRAWVICLHSVRMRIQDANFKAPGKGWRSTVEYHLSGRRLQMFGS